MFFYLELLKSEPFEKMLQETIGFRREILNSDFEAMNDLYQTDRIYRSSIGTGKDYVEEFYQKFSEDFLNFIFYQRGSEVDSNAPIKELPPPLMFCSYAPVIEVAKYLCLPSKRYNDNDISKILEKYDFYDREQDYWFWDVLSLLSYIYEKYQVSGYNLFWLDVEIDDYTAYTRPDLLYLYKMFHEKKKTKSSKVIISYNNNKIELPNHTGWFLNMITPFLDKHLGSMTLEEAEKELKDDYSTKKTRGRKRDFAYDNLLISLYNLLKHSFLDCSDKLLSDNEAEFMLEFMMYLGAIKEDSPKNDILHLRASIDYLVKNEFKPVWFSFPMYKMHPADKKYLEENPDKILKF